MPRSPASNSGLFFSTTLAATPLVSLSNISALQGLTSVTIEAWIYLTAYTTATTRIFNYLTGSTGYQFGIGTTANINASIGNSTTTGSGNSSAQIPLNQWAHVAVSWDGTNVRAFTAGVLSATNALSSGNTGNPATTPLIGNQTGGGRAFPGIISELRISNVARYTATFTPPTAPFTPDANTVGLYHLWEGTGTTVNDSSASANTGTLSGSPLPVWSPGKFIGGGTSRTVATNRSSVQNFNSSLNFNGTSTKNTLTQTSGLPVFSQSGYSVTGWFKSPGVSAGNTLGLYTEANTANNTQNFAIFYRSTDNTVRVTVSNNAGSTQLSAVGTSTKVPFNTWTHFAWVDNNGTASLYIDAVKDTTNFNYTPVTPYTYNTSSLGFINRLTPAAFFPGSLAGFQLFNTALSVSQVQQVFSGSLLGNIGSYSLGEGSQTTTYDTSGNANNGTITSGTYTADVPSKTRGLIGGNMVYNPSFEFAPVVNVATSSTAVWIDGTSGGSITNSLFGWGVESHVGTSTVIFDSSTSNSGNQSIKLSTTAISSRIQIGASTSGAFAAINHLIPILPSTSYTLSLWIKTTANSGSATTGAFASIDYRNGIQGFLQLFSIPGITTTTGWTKYTLIGTSPSTAAFADILLTVTGNDGTGTLIMDAWFDDITLTPTVNTVRTLAT